MLCIVASLLRQYNISCENGNITSLLKEAHTQKIKTFNVLFLSALRNVFCMHSLRDCADDIIFLLKKWQICEPFLAGPCSEGERTVFSEIAIKHSVPYSMANDAVL